jgi:hypothetical protein
MDQKSIVQYLARKELSLREISSDLEVMLWVEVINYQFMTHDLRETKCASGNSPQLVSEPENPTR